MAKKNLRKVPPTIRGQLKDLGLDVVAGCSRTFKADDLKAGKLKHLGIELSTYGLSFPASIVPPATSGKYSDRNINGHEVVRRDLPKETHYNPVEAPDWGDSTLGTHTVYLPYEKYPRDFHAPQLASIKISAPQTVPSQSVYVIVFEVDRVLKQKDADFEEDLLEALNLLQENVGGVGVQKSGASFADYLKTMTVNWELLPPGTIDEVVARLFRGRKPSPEEKQIVQERYDFLMSLNPQQLVIGMSGIQRYFGALITNDLVVFENIEYGNAIYIMFEDWKELSKRSRTELLSGRFGTNFERITHGSGWKKQVKDVIAEGRKKSKK
jgi:hypothetical protein